MYVYTVITVVASTRSNPRSSVPDHHWWCVLTSPSDLGQYLFTMNNLKSYNLNCNYNTLPFKRRPEQALYFPTVDMTFAQYTTSTGRRSSILENGYHYLHPPTITSFFSYILYFSHQDVYLMGHKIRPIVSTFSNGGWGTKRSELSVVWKLEIPRERRERAWTQRPRERMEAMMSELPWCGNTLQLNM